MRTALTVLLFLLMFLLMFLLIGLLYFVYMFLVFEYLVGVGLNNPLVIVVGAVVGFALLLSINSLFHMVLNNTIAKNEEDIEEDNEMCSSENGKSIEQIYMEEEIKLKKALINLEVVYNNEKQQLEKHLKQNQDLQNIFKERNNLDAETIKAKIETCFDLGLCIPISIDMIPKNEIDLFLGIKSKTRQK